MTVNELFTKVYFVKPDTFANVFLYDENTKEIQFHDQDFADEINDLYGQYNAVQYYMQDSVINVCINKTKYEK